MGDYVNVNGVEKQRLRNVIEEQVRRFLERGGNITVLDGPDTECFRYRGSACCEGDESALLD